MGRTGLKGREQKSDRRRDRVRGGSEMGRWLEKAEGSGELSVQPAPPLRKLTCAVRWAQERPQGLMSCSSPGEGRGPSFPPSLPWARPRTVTVRDTKATGVAGKSSIGGTSV